MTATLAIANQATDRQLSFLNTLRVERGYVAIHADDWTGVTKARASKLIDEMKAMPRANAPRPDAPRVGYLDGLPLSKYSVIEEGVRTFWEIKRFKETTYMRLLVGAPGEFNRVKVGLDRARTVASEIRQDPAAAALAFANHYVCCAVCGAELSDPVSVALGLGPVCRTRFGF